MTNAKPVLRVDKKDFAPPEQIMDDEEIRMRKILSFIPGRAPAPERATDYIGLTLPSDSTEMKAYKNPNRTYVYVPTSTKIGIGASIDTCAKIGENCEIGSFVKIGGWTRVGKGCKIDKRVKISSNTLIGDYCHIEKKLLLELFVKLDPTLG